MKRILLSTTSYQDTPGEHHALLDDQDFEIVCVRGPLSEEQMLELGDDFDIIDFHHEILKRGSLPLSILETYINEWIYQSKES